MNHGVLLMIRLRSRSSRCAMGCSFHRLVLRRPLEFGCVKRRPTNVIDYIKCYVNINVHFSWRDVDTLDVLPTMQVEPRRVVKAAPEPLDGDSQRCSRIPEVGASSGQPREFVERSPVAS